MTRARHRPTCGVLDVLVVVSGPGRGVSIGLAFNRLHRVVREAEAFLDAPNHHAVHMIVKPASETADQCACVYISAAYREDSSPYAVTTHSKSTSKKAGKFSMSSMSKPPLALTGEIGESKKRLTAAVKPRMTAIREARE